jgi:hypothetical protein
LRQLSAIVASQILRPAPSAGSIATESARTTKGASWWDFLSLQFRLDADGIIPSAASGSLAIFEPFATISLPQAIEIKLIRPMPKHDDLIEQAKKLGVPINSGTYKPKTEAWDELAITDYELHRRIREEQRHRREHRLWIVAVVSAVIALLSALIAFVSAVAAWLAVPNTPQ